VNVISIEHIGYREKYRNINITTAMREWRVVNGLKRVGWLYATAANINR